MLKKLYYLSLLTLSLGQFSRVASFGDSKIYLFDLMVGLYAITGTFYFLISKYKILVSRYLIFFYMFSFVAVLSLLPKFGLLSQEDLFVAIFYLLRWVFYLQAANITYNLVKNRLISKQELYLSIIYSGVLIAILGFIQLVVLPDFTVLDLSLGWDPHKNRLTSTFFDPNFTGGYLVIIFTLLLYYKYLGMKDLLKGKKHLFLIITILTALFLTYSRSSWGMLGIILFVYGIKISRKLVVLSLIIALLTYFAVPRIQTRLAGITDPADSARFRLISWSNALQISKDHLWMGVGFNAFKKAQIDYGFLDPDTVKEHSATGSDSSFLLVLATTGIFGFLFYIIGYFYPVIKGRNIIISTMLWGFLLHTQFVNSLFYPQIMFVWLSLIALAKEIKPRS